MTVWHDDEERADGEGEEGLPGRSTWILLVKYPEVIVPTHFYCCMVACNTLLDRDLHVHVPVSDTV